MFVRGGTGRLPSPGCNIQTNELLLRWQIIPTTAVRIRGGSLGERRSQICLSDGARSGGRYRSQLTIICSTILLIKARLYLLERQGAETRVIVVRCALAAS